MSLARARPQVTSSLSDFSSPGPDPWAWQLMRSSLPHSHLYLDNRQEINETLRPWPDEHPTAESVIDSLPGCLTASVFSVLFKPQFFSSVTRVFYCLFIHSKNIFINQNRLDISISFSLSTFLYHSSKSVSRDNFPPPGLITRCSSLNICSFRELNIKIQS